MTKKNYTTQQRKKKSKAISPNWHDKSASARFYNNDCCDGLGYESWEGGNFGI